ncbi:hypothetical protein OG824_32750 [Streptomyces prunicolor]|uniref:hypothetical protein n=1 Tax=Streptomyces prunicolor TaxID=67348 RepID=UPI00225BA25B|nr:hypothetical protein [Streptomyces prunicolor]MCX5239985.1 hypothetical protein [Streptomyces prunicolor]
MAYEIHITRHEDCGEDCRTGSAQWSALLNTRHDESRFGTALHRSERGISARGLVFSGRRP